MRLAAREDFFSFGFAPGKVTAGRAAGRPGQAGLSQGDQMTDDRHKLEKVEIDEGGGDVVKRFKDY